MNNSDNSSRHVIFVVKDLGYFLSHRQDLANYLAGRGLSVSLVTDLQGRESFPGRNNLVHVCNVPFSSAKLRPWKLVVPTLAMTKLLFLNRKATVFSITLPAVLISGLICKLLKIRQIILFAGLGNSFHGPPNFPRRLLRVLIRFVANKPNTSVIAQNSSIKKLLEEQRYAVDVSLILGSGIDAQSFTLTQEKPSSGRPKILLLGRMLKEKGVLEFIQAAKLTLAAGYAADFVLAGRTDPINPTSLTEAQLTQELRDQPNIRWIGESKNVKDILRSSDIVCLPSYHEGLPRTLLEGALMGCCLVATDIPGSNDVVISGKTGILVAAKSPHALAEGFVNLLMDSKNIRKLAANAKAHVMKNFTNDIILPQYFDIITKF